MCSLHRELPLGPHFAGVSNLVRALPVAAAVATLQVQSLTEPPLGPEGGAGGCLGRSRGQEGARLPQAAGCLGTTPSALGTTPSTWGPPLVPGDHP